ncbi:hypothetical protein JCM16814_04160 [Desulfobaculum senezii]|jgi:hypothetical protein
MTKLSRIFATVCIASIMLIGAGCSSNPTVDSSSKSAFNESVQEIQASLPEEKRQEFQETLTGMAMLVAMQTGGDQTKMREFFDGMDYDAIMTKADEMRRKVNQ